MPDGDIFCRAAAFGWRPVATAIRDGLPPDQCGLHLERVITAHVRRVHGLDDPELGALVDCSGAGRDELSIQHALEQLAHRKVLDRIVPLLIGPERFPTFAAAERFTRACLDATRLDVIARSLARRPQGNIRRPPVRRQSITTLLNEPAALGERA